MRFFHITKREYIEVPDSELRKKIYTRETAKGRQERYVVRTTVEGLNLTKFISKEVFDSLLVPIES